MNLKPNSLPFRVAAACAQQGKTRAQLLAEMGVTPGRLNKALTSVCNGGAVLKTGPVPSTYIAVTPKPYIPETTIEHAKRNVPRSVFDLGERL